MAAGLLTDSSGTVVSLASNSCSDVGPAYRTANGWPADFAVITCSADPVTLGTVITLAYPNGYSGVFSVVGMTATASSGSAPSGPPQYFYTCSSACTITLQHEFSLPPFTLSTSEGAQIGLAMVGVLAVGFCFRMLYRVMDMPLGGGERLED